MLRKSAIGFGGEAGWPRRICQFILGPVFLSPQFVRGHGFADFEVPIEGLAASGVLRTGEIRLLQFDEGALGPYRFESMLASYAIGPNRGMNRREASTGSRIRRAKSRSDGLLGDEILRNFLVTTDFRNRKVHLHLQ